MTPKTPSGMDGYFGEPRVEAVADVPGAGSAEPPTKPLTVAAPEQPPMVVPGLAPLLAPRRLVPVPPQPPGEPGAAGLSVSPSRPLDDHTVDAVRAGAADNSQHTSFLASLLDSVVDSRASDLHLAVGAPPMIRIRGALRPVDDYSLLSGEIVQQTMYAIMTQRQRERFEQDLELDFAYSMPGRARFRVNVYRQRDSIGAAFRLIPQEIKTLDSLGMPEAVKGFAMLPRGFVLVTGPTGSGKSTTLAAIVDQANRSRTDHIMTVEDPIEFLHTHNRCLVNQREVGEDTWSFTNALKHVLRQDPDIIMLGEMRDLETIEIALTAAETGHLVMATLHTQDAAQSIDRVIDVFPPIQQQQVRVQLASSLQGVMCQQLLKTADGSGRVVATEVLVATPAIRNLIREGKTHQIYSALQAGAKFGMNTMDQSLADLVKSGRVSYPDALKQCHHAEDFTRLAGRA